MDVGTNDASARKPGFGIAVKSGFVRDFAPNPRCNRVGPENNPGSPQELQLELQRKVKSLRFAMVTEVSGVRRGYFTAIRRFGAEIVRYRFSQDFLIFSRFSFSNLRN